MVKFLKRYTTCCNAVSLYKDGKLVLDGDYYHNHIHDRIEAYLQAYRDLGIEYEVESVAYEKCPYNCGCDDDDWTDFDEDED